MDKRVYLKVKIKSLAEEARIIRKEEKKNKYFKEGLADHRKGVVRYEARHAILAYSFLRGRKYSEIENKCHTAPDWPRFMELVKKYGYMWDADISNVEYSKKKEEERERAKDWGK